ncbi:MFS general substrate transporter [Favolaschia claudopus]|uniref:MFS general substrate transporter n=1 Tax=Favolaschia claudopus TaxID=2862362 RepID=A0AAW0B709_9AGAR
MASQPTSASPTPVPPEEKSTTDQKSGKPGASWKADETQHLPKNRLSIAAMDQTIVATALPTIVEKLGGGNLYSAYLLAAATLGPLYGKLSAGRKPPLYTSIVIFLIGSALCGAAQDMTWLVVARAVQGVGGGGILQLVNITIGDIVSLEDRGKYIGLLGATWGIASVVGPTGGVAAALLFFFLNLNPRPLRTLREHNREFDYLGLVIVVSAVVCLLLGFNFSESSWSSPQTIALLAVGGVLLVVFSANEIMTTRSPIIPPRLFRTRTTAILLVTTFFHALAFFAGAYYLPLYFQVLGSSATGAGVRMLPYSLGGALVSASSGQIVTRIKAYRPVIWFAWPVMTLGYGLMITLDDKSGAAKESIFPLIAALGIGCLFQTPLIGLQAAMPIKDMATSTSTYGFIRQVGGTVSIAMGQAIITSTLRKKLAHIPNLSVDIDTSPAALSQSVGILKSIPDPTQRQEIIHAYARSISTIWLVVTPIIGVAFVMSLFIRKYTLARTVVRSPGKGEIVPAQEAGDLEKKAGKEVTPGASESGEVNETNDNVPERGKEGEGEGDAATVQGHGSIDMHMKEKEGA